MMRIASVLVFVVTAPLALSGFSYHDRRPTSVTPSEEIDAQVWSPIKASVVNADIQAMGSIYHPAAVLVSNSGTKAISGVLEGWGKDMAVAKKNGDKANVEFRFDKRQDDATTAFETGAFRYTTIDRSGKSTSAHIRMEALLIKSNGRWLILMERQLNTITETEWNQLPH